MTAREFLFLGLVAACSAAIASPSADEGAPEGGALQIALQPVVAGPARPTGLHDPKDGSGRLFIVTKDGTIQIFDGNQMLPTPFLDIRDRVNDSGVERGLHGLAFDPDYTSNGYFYVVYTNLQSDSILGRYRVTDDPNVADPDSEEVVLFVDQPDQYHNVSQLQFGPDGYLYIGAGDGGFIGDPGNRAQNLSELLGKILRIDVRSAFPYAIPPDNPFVNTPGARPEIWAYGVRNPWRFSFDRLTGDLLMGDVGQFSWEEINFQPANSSGGENYGWRLMEGFHCYNPPSDCNDGTLTLPILEYPHGPGCAVIGGYRYRGERFPRFYGVYFYSDWCTGRIFGARPSGEGWVSMQLLDSPLSPTAFGETAAGELYISDDNTGMIHALIDPVPFCDVKMSQKAYVQGQTATIQAFRLANLGATAFSARAQVVLQRPVGPPIELIDVGEDGSLVLSPGTELTRGPIPLFTVNPDTPKGAYKVTCRLTDSGTGQVVHVDRNAFAVP